MQPGRSRQAPEVREQQMRQTLLVLWECGAHHPRLSDSAKRSGSLGGGVLVSRTDIHSPSVDVDKLFPASLAWGLESLSVGALLDSGTDECLIDMTLARQGWNPPRTYGSCPICAGARRSLPR